MKDKALGRLFSLCSLIDIHMSNCRQVDPKELHKILHRTYEEARPILQVLCEGTGDFEQQDRALRERLQQLTTKDIKFYREAK